MPVALNGRTKSHYASEYRFYRTIGTSPPSLFTPQCTRNIVFFISKTDSQIRKFQQKGQLCICILDSVFPLGTNVINGEAIEATLTSRRMRSYCFLVDEGKSSDMAGCV